MKHKMRLSLSTALFAMLFGLLGAVRAADEYVSYSQITVSGYTGESTLADFPVLVRIAENSPAGFSYADCNSDGSDIFFVDSAGNKLAHEIDTWNTEGESCIWVKLPALAQGTTFEMRYGGTPSAGNTPSEVWSNYIGVWHMSESSGNVLDSTGHGLHGVPTEPVENYTPVRECIVGSARNFGANELVKVPDYHNTYGGSNVFSASGWFYFQDVTTAAYYSIFNKKTTDGAVWSSANGWYIEVQNNFTRLSYNVGGTTSKGNLTVPSVNEYWNFLYLVSDGSVVSLYNNGELLGTISKAIPPSSCSLGFMAKGGCGDEFRMSGAAASADYIKADYAAQTDTLLTMGEVKLMYNPMFSVNNVIGYIDAQIKITMESVGIGSTSASVSLAYGTDPEALGAASVIKADAIVGEVLSVDLSGLDDNTCYYYQITAVNDSNLETVKTFSFTTLTHTAPEVRVSPDYLIAPPAVRVALDNIGDGASSCDVYFTSGADEAALPEFVKVGEVVTSGTVITNVVEIPASTNLYYSVKVVNNNGLEFNDSGSFKPGDRWLYDTKKGTISDLNGWIFPVSTVATLDSGVREISVNKNWTPGTDGVLDLRKRIVWETEESFTSAEIVTISKDCFYSDTTAVTNLYLPDTLRTLGEYCFRGLKTVTTVEPFIPNSVTYINAPFGNAYALRADLVLGGGGEDLTMAGGAGSIRASAVMSITFGTGNISVSSQFFWGCTACTNVTFLGDQVTWANESFASWKSYQCVIRVPAASTWWADFIANNTSFVAWENVSTANQNTYWSKFDPEKKGPAPLGTMRLSNSGQGLSTQYVMTFSKETSTRDITVAGDPVYCGEVSPAYTPYPEEHLDMPETVAFSASEYASLDGVHYRCAGYVVETMGAAGWENAVTNLGVTAFDYAAVTGQQRITWLWETIGYKVVADATTIDGYNFGSVIVDESDYPDNHYVKDSYVEFTAVANDAANAPFVRWCGADVPAGHEYDNPLRVKADRAKTVYPYFKANWTYADGAICDGYWKFKVGSLGNGELQLGTGQASLDNSTVWNGGFFDLDKPINDGYSIVSVCKDFFYGTYPAVSQLVREMTLPDTIRTLGEYCFNSLVNLISCVPFVPASVTVYNHAFISCCAITNDFTIGSWDDTPISWGGSGEEFSRTRSFRRATFGRGVTSLPTQLFYDNDTSLDIYFMGDVIANNFGTSLRGCNAYTKRIFAPRGNSTWTEYLSTNVTDWASLSESEQAQYTSRWPDAPSPLGYGTIGGTSKQWFLKWTPRNNGLRIFVR